MRDIISQSLGVSLDPEKVKDSKSYQELNLALQFILNNSHFDQNKNMIRVADILRQDENRIFALLDNMVNMTEHCQAYINETLKSLNFADKTIGK